MKFGFTVMADIDEIGFFSHAEALGYHSVWGNDHMTTQRYVRAEFPVPPRFWEPLVTYSFIAANTTRLRLGTGVLVLPMRRDIVDPVRNPEGPRALILRGTADGVKRRWCC